MMQVNTAVFIILLVLVTLGTFIVVGAFAAMAIALRKIEQQVEKLIGKVEPLVLKASNTLDTVQRITVNVGEKTDAILTKGEALTDDLAVKVENTSTVVQKSVTSPLISLSSLISGLAAGVSVWSRAASENAKYAGQSGFHRNGANGSTLGKDERVTVSPNGR